MKLYDKNGKEYNVPHAIDRKEWLASGDFFEKNPKAKIENKKVSSRD